MKKLTREMQSRIYKVEKTSVPFTNLLNDLLNKEYDRLIELIEPHVK